MTELCYSRTWRCAKLPVAQRHEKDIPQATHEVPIPNTGWRIPGNCQVLPIPGPPFIQSQLVDSH